MKKRKNSAYINIQLDKSNLFRYNYPYTPKKIAQEAAGLIFFNKKSNLLEDSIYHYELQDVEEPVLYRDLFDYESIPKVTFNNRKVPMNMPEEIWITDTTFRDGQQSTSPFTVKQIVDLYKLMSRSEERRVGKDCR